MLSSDYWLRRRFQPFYQFFLVQIIERILWEKYYFYLVIIFHDYFIYELLIFVASLSLFISEELPVIKPVQKPGHFFLWNNEFVL